MSMSLSVFSQSLGMGPNDKGATILSGRLSHYESSYTLGLDPGPLCPRQVCNPLSYSDSSFVITRILVMIHLSFFHPTFSSNYSQVNRQMETGYQLDW